MKKSFLIILLLTLAVVYSCSEDFNPFGEFRNNYVLTCILKSDTTFQVAALSRNYLPPNGFDPYSNTVDPAIVGADIRVWLGDSVYIFSDSLIVREDSSRYSTPFNFYYNTKFKIPPKQNIEVEVLLQNGERMNASSKAPDKVLFDKESDVIIPAVNSNLVKFLWAPQVEGTFFSPKLRIRYIQNENGSNVEKFKDVPVNYVERNGNLETVFPEPSNKTIVIYQLSAITRALEEISEGDPNKSNYTVRQSLVFDVVAFDLNLSRYVSSTNQPFDDLTVTVNESDYTNVEGGLGIFGAYIKSNYPTIKFQPAYIESFGYHFLLDD